MINRYPFWKYVLVVTVALIGLLYATPNLFGEDPAIQVAPLKVAQVEVQTRKQIKAALDRAEIAYNDIEYSQGRLLIRFPSTEEQLQAVDLVKKTAGKAYGVALNLAPSTPAWLRSLNAGPMYLGLDLRGGVHFLLDVDMESALKQAEESYIEGFRTLLRGEKVRYVSIKQKDGVRVRFRDAEARDLAIDLIKDNFSELVVTELDEADKPLLVAILSEQEQRSVQKFALQQNITTLRNRVNELGVAEPVIQRQGDRRIVVQLPGVQDTVKAKEILGATATLEYRPAVSDQNKVRDAMNGRIPPGTRLYKERDGTPVLLKNRIIVTGDQVDNASSSFDENNQPAVTVTLDGKGARRMARFTKDNIGKPMAVVFIENKVETRMVDGKPVKFRTRTEEVISVATIRGAFSKRFQTTGLDSAEEARNLALLLRAGALATPIEIVEERTVGPSLGKDNIDKGFMSVQIGFVMVLIFMAVYYRTFGMVANVALLMNMVLIVAVLSMLQATLTLPGIAGIVLTIGMAVDANVLIFERIREELRSGNTPQASIDSGYSKALSTIADANITTLIAAVVLFSFGTGPIKGFAVTLSIGILTSMFTAIMGTRAIVNFIYGGRKVKKLSI